MNEKLKELAEQAGLYIALNNRNVPDIERFAELVRQDEREQCAKDYLEDCAKAVEAAKQECETCANKRKRLMDAGFLNSPLRGEDHVD